MQFRIFIASMRPRVFPAEDEPLVNVIDGSIRASMRPRVFPAEDDRQTPGSTSTISLASMRPRVFPAEDVCAGHDSGQVLVLQ